MAAFGVLIGFQDWVLRYLAWCSGRAGLIGGIDKSTGTLRSPALESISRAVTVVTVFFLLFYIDRGFLSWFF
jgi:hypothetical protein